jgi:hypothetical protein
MEGMTMWIQATPNRYVIEHAVADAISAVLGNIHGLPHGLTVAEATEVAVKTIVSKGFEV